MLLFLRGTEMETPLNNAGEYSLLLTIFPLDSFIKNGAGLKKAIALLSWGKWINKELNKIQNVNIVHACNLDACREAYKYCQKNDCRFVYDIYDYYIDSHAIPAALKKLVGNEEIKMIDAADLTIICTEERREQIVKAKPKRVLVIHNSPEIDQLTECKRGIELDSQDPESIAQAITTMCELSENEYRNYCQTAAECAQKFDYKELCNQLISVIHQSLYGYKKRK